jgi:hypothetical protein
MEWYAFFIKKALLHNFFVNAQYITLFFYFLMHSVTFYADV